MDLAAAGSHLYPFLPVRFLLRDRFPVLEHLESSEVPVTVVYGDRDTVVNVALPTISDELGAGVSGLQWIVDGYVLAFAGSALFVGLGAAGVVYAAVTVVASS